MSTVGVEVGKTTEARSTATVGAIVGAIVGVGCTITTTARGAGASGIAATCAGVAGTSVGDAPGMVAVGSGGNVTTTPISTMAGDGVADARGAGTAAAVRTR